MNRRYFFPTALALAAVAGCIKCKDGGQLSGIDLNNLDTTAVCTDDFYQFACGGWMKRNPLSGEYARFGSFDFLAENNKKQLHALIEELAGQQNAQGTVAQKIGDIYNLAMDSARLNSDGMKPIADELTALERISTHAELVQAIAELDGAAFFTYYVDADIMESDRNLFQLYQGGLSLGQKEYYIDEDDVTTDLRNKFRQHVARMFALTGCDAALCDAKADAVMEIETRIARKSFSATEQRDPVRNYHKMTFDDLQRDFAGFDWQLFMQSINAEGVTELSVSQIEPIKEVVEIVRDTPMEKIIYYLQWKLVDEAAAYLSDDFVGQNFEFYGRVLSGKTELQPRWKRAVSSVNGMLGEAVGQMYVQKYFPAEAKKRMVELVKNLQKSLGDRIAALTWMGDSTKNMAREKLEAFYVKVGYPDKWRDYSNLDVARDDSYWTCVQKASKFERAYMLSKAGKPVDRDEWYMTPQTVNAYYNPTTNEICFPAGILQYPFFDMTADDAFNYGAIGVVIGHEMTHGFDDQGRQFDKEGNLRDWWTAADAERFSERAEVMKNFFDAIEVLPGLHANGALTLGENLADHGGLQIAFDAFKSATKDAPLPVADGFTPEQRFFLAYAGVWAGNIRDEEVRRRTKSDPHSLGQWRVNGALPHIKAWYEAFDVTESSPMFLPEEQRLQLW